MEFICNSCKGNNKEIAKYAEMVKNMLVNLQDLRVNMSIKLQYFHSYLVKFPDDTSDKQGKYFASG